MNFNKSNMKKLLCLIAFGVILGWVLQNIDIARGYLAALIAILSPFIIGLCIAFILNVPMRAIENILFNPKRVKANSKLKKLYRPISLVLTIILFVVIIGIVVFLVVPKIGDTVQVISQKMPTFIKNVQKWAQPLIDKWPEIESQLGTFEIDWKKLSQSAVEFLQSGATNVLNSTLSIATGVFNALTNFVLGLIFAIYVLLQKEKLASQLNRTMYAYLPQRKADWISKVVTMANSTFSKFMTGQCLEAVILGTMFFLSMSILRFPYALMISVLIAFMALIPIFGAFIGLFIGAFLIMVASPIKALWFIVLFLVLQQIEGNLIYPKVVGTSVGLPGIWVLVAVTIGGSTMGIFGMLIGVPIASILYSLLRESVNSRTLKKLNTVQKQDEQIKTDKPADTKKDLL